jgi:DNA-binding XRE family transcriptional regulator
MKKYNLSEKSIRGLTNKSPLDTMNDRIEFVRCVLGYPVSAFASRIGSSKHAVVNVCGERSDFPTIAMVENMCKVLPVNKVWIYAGVGEPFEGSIEQYMYSKESTVQEVDTGINQRIKEIRASLGFTQALFAAEMKTTRDSLAFIETNKSNASVHLIKAVIKKYGVNPMWLLFGEGNHYLRPVKS